MNEQSIADYLKLASQLDAVSDSSRLDIELLLSHALKKNRTYLATWPEKKLTPEENNLFQAIFLRRKKGEPIAHIIGEREFWSLPLSVNASTLIPRPDTEILVQAVLDLFKNDLPNQKRIGLDLGTGTGAIALALAHEKKHWQLLGVDKSEPAVELAKLNQKKLNVTNVNFLSSDWFSKISNQEKFDFILSNPPYIVEDDPHLTQGDVVFEPKSALVADKNGLADIEIICSTAPLYLKQSAYLFIEHGYQQADSVQNIFSTHGFVEIQTLKDYGGNPRVTFGKIK